MFTVSLVMPFLNEIEYLPLTVSKAKSVFDTAGINYEIILVDDASHDGSELLAEQLAGKNSAIKVYHHEATKGLGAALATGFRHARYDVIIYTDMDMPFDFSILPKTIKLIEDADIVHGYRIGQRESLLRAIYSQTYNFLIRGLFGYRTKDINFAMTIFKKEVFNKFSVRSCGSFFSAEFLLKSYFSGCNIVDVPVTFNPREYGQSRLASIDNILKIFFELIKYYPEIKSLQSQTSNLDYANAAEQKIFNG